jgi:hypothetical protein
MVGGKYDDRSPTQRRGFSYLFIAVQRENDGNKYKDKVIARERLYDL